MSCCCTERFLPNTPTTEAGNFLITSLDAGKLTNIRRYGRKMRVYAKVFLKGDVSVSVKTAVDTDPSWNNLGFEFTVEETSILTVDLYCERTRGDKRIGSVEIGVSHLLPQKPVGAEATAVCDVIDVQGNRSGDLQIKYKTSLSTEPYYSW